MYCFQCEQVAKGEACTTVGVCGKDQPTAELQDLLIHSLKGIANYAHAARKLGAKDHEIDTFTVKSLFRTLTNVNFDHENFMQQLAHASKLHQKAQKLYQDAAASTGHQGADPGAAGSPKPSEELDEQLNRWEDVSILGRKNAHGDDITSLQELITYGLKGLAAYADHAQILGRTDDEVYAFFHEALDFLTKTDPTVDALVGYALKVGEVNLKVMGMLDEAHTTNYGHPEPTPVRITPRQGKAILVSGHDLKDLEELLRQTEGKGINVYTHSEMLPANAYPGLKKYAHLAGNYGGAWQDQRTEFEAFPGSILMTTNCIQRPKDSYKDRIFTKGLVGWPGVKHIEENDYTPLIDAALAAPGFAADGEDKTILVGFGHNAVLNAAGKVVELVQAGKIKHFFLIGGCDGAKSGRNYYTEFAEQVPDDCVILTLACGKYRFNKLDFGDIDGIPRLLDIGQCNDAYSAIQIAVALAEAFKTDVNSLPLSLILSWFEQKACVILLSLLHLGIKNIKLGPSLPAFVSPTVLNVLVENYNIAPISTAKEDLQAILG